MNFRQHHRRETPLSVRWVRYSLLVLLVHGSGCFPPVRITPPSADASAEEGRATIETLGDILADAVGEVMERPA